MFSLKIVKFKHASRIADAVQTSAGIYFLYECYRKVSSVNHSEIFQTITGDHHLGHKLAATALVGIEGLIVTVAVPISLILIVDGVVGMYKGAHHYFLSQIGKRISNDLETKKFYEMGIEALLKGREDKLL